jgi:hypothetical protein
MDLVECLLHCLDCSDLRSDDNMRISLFLMVFIITTFLFSASATDYTIDNDLIYIDDNNVYLSAYPHTLSESGYVYFNLTSKQYSGNIDFLFGFNSFQCKPISAEVLIADNWIDISDRFNSINYNYDGLNKWYHLNEISIYSNTNYTLRAYLQINKISTGGKYGVAVKPSAETISQSINNGHFYYLDPWWNGSWNYRKTITLTGNTSGAQTDYQLLLNVTYDSNMQADFDDLRFTNDTHQIDAWLESNTTDYALIWVEFPTTPADGINQDYYMYYGNESVISNWNIDATFLFGDEFLGSSLNTSIKWDIISGSPVVSAGALWLDYADRIDTKTWTGNNVRLRCEATVPNEVGSTVWSAIGFSENTQNYACEFITYWNWDVRSIDVGGVGETTTINTYNGEHIFEIEKLGNTFAKFYVDNVLEDTDTAHVENVAMPIKIHKSGGNDLVIDWVFTSKYVPNPAVYTFGTEEKSSCIPPDPINLQNTTGDFWINHIWQAGAGNVTDFYNISVNNVWHNETINTYWNITYEYGNNSWQNITIWAYNNTNMGSLSTDSISQNTQLLFTNLPTNLQQTHDHIWVNWTWDESFLGTHTIDSYNVSINSTWHNSTTNRSYNHTGYDYGTTSLIIVYGYNNTQGLSLYYISGSYTFLTRYKIVETLKQLVTPIQIIKDKFFNIIPFIISIILFAGFGLAIMVMTSRLKKW